VISRFQLLECRQSQLEFGWLQDQQNFRADGGIE
jgi:hypothetical protein